VQGEGGIRPVDPAFLDQVARLCAAHGTLFALDEIQTGLGRCGRVWRTADDSPPDLLLIGKVLGGGVVPVAAVVYAGSRIGASSTDPITLASSFAGGAPAARAATAVLDLVTRPVFLDGVNVRGEGARRALAPLVADDRVVDVRGEGLMLGLQAASPAVAGHLVLEAARRGVLLSFCLSDPTVLRIYPTALIDEADLTDGLARIVDAVFACPIDL
jgi:acetylornithine aminotransferase/putrescine aminotransferase